MERTARRGCAIGRRTSYTRKNQPPAITETERSEILALGVELPHLWNHLGHRRKHASRSFGQWSRRSPSPRDPDYCRSSCIGKVATIRVLPWPSIARDSIVGKPVQRQSN